MADRPLSIKEVTDRKSDNRIGSRSYVYSEIGAGRLKALKFGRSIRIMQSERDRYVASRPTAVIRLADGK